MGIDVKKKEKGKEKGMKNVPSKRKEESIRKLRFIVPDRSCVLRLTIRPRRRERVNLGTNRNDESFSRSALISCPFSAFYFFACMSKRSKGAKDYQT